jgi:uncharacterized protein YjlB
MPAVETLKRLAERATGIGRPSADEIAAAIRPRKANAWCFHDDGVTPNHPRWPLIVYRGVFRFGAYDPAALFEDAFAHNGWGDSWRNGIYDYNHYHSRIHEVLGVARGRAKVRFGGAKGRALTIKAGDVAILPAGTGHQCLEASADFVVVGAYPPQGQYDECASAQDHARAVKTVGKVARPRKDPLYGGKGPLLLAWAAR